MWLGTSLGLAESAGQTFVKPFGDFCCCRCCYSILISISAKTSSVLNANVFRQRWDHCDLIKNELKWSNHILFWQFFSCRKIESENWTKRKHKTKNIRYRRINWPHHSADVVATDNINLHFQTCHVTMWNDHVILWKWIMFTVVWKSFMSFCKNDHIKCCYFISFNSMLSEHDVF